jgi:hypothetical protein
MNVRLNMFVVAAAIAAGSSPAVAADASSVN